MTPYLLHKRGPAGNRSMAETKSRRKSVNVTFSGDDDVVQHIVDSRSTKPGENY